MVKWDPNAVVEGGGQAGERSTGSTVTKRVPKLQSLLQNSSFTKTDENSEIENLRDGFYLVEVVQEKDSYMSLYDIS
jgi:hypothetical protein